MSQPDASPTYWVTCHDCQMGFDALEAAWCPCIVLLKRQLG